MFGIIVEDEEDHLIDNVVFENENVDRGIGKILCFMTISICFHLFSSDFQLKNKRA